MFVISIFNFVCLFVCLFVAAFLFCSSLFLDSTFFLAFGALVVRGPHAVDSEFKSKYLLQFCFVRLCLYILYDFSLT